MHIGIDAGGTLTKIAFCENINTKVLYRRFLSTDVKGIVDFLNSFPKTALYNFTGGRSEKIMKQMIDSNNTSQLMEFDATTIGVQHLVTKQHETLQNAIITNIGTGTSIHLWNDGVHSRIGGTGVGGGMLVGMASLFSPDSNLEDAREKSKQGNRAAVDMLVSDIYEDGNTPINKNLTASNFGKLGLHNVVEFQVEDLLASTQGVIGEVVATLSVQYAQTFNVESIVYIGSTLEHNDLLREILSNYTEMKGKQAVYLDDHGFAGAIGAMLYKM